MVKTRLLLKTVIPFLTRADQSSPALPPASRPFPCPASPVSRTVHAKKGTPTEQEEILPMEFY